MKKKWQSVSSSISDRFAYIYIYIHIIYTYRGFYITMFAFTGKSHLSLLFLAGEGENYGVLTARYVSRLKREKGIMLAVCTSDCGEMTDSPVCTCDELKSAVDYKIDILPLQVEDEWQPNRVW